MKYQRLLFGRTAVSKFAFFMVLLYTSAIQASAQTDGDTLRLDLQAAMEIAREKNPGLAVAGLEMERMDAGIDIARGRYLPSLSASGGYTRNIQKPVIFLPPGSPFGDVLEIGSDNSYMGTLVAGMPVYNPQLNAALNAARAERELAGEEYRASRIELEYFVRSAFFDALLAKESREVMRMSMQNASENLERTRKLHGQGMVAEFDMIRAQVQTENLRPAVLQAENGFEMAVNYLKALIGLQSSDAIAIEGRLTDLATEMMAGFSIPDAERSLVRNTDLVQMELQMKLIRQQAKTIRASGLPSLAMSGNYNVQTEANHFEFSDYNWIKTFAAGLRLTVPIFNGLTIRNQAKQLDIVGKQMQVQRDFLEENLGVQLDNILRSLIVAVETSNTARRTVVMAERAHEISKARYDTGQGTLLDVNDSELALTQARFNLLQARYDVLKAKAEYEKFIGQNH
ncbi:MAG: TolC family protein [Bacteroidales bacterium]